VVAAGELAQAATATLRVRGPSDWLALSPREELGEMIPSWIRSKSAGRQRFPDVLVSASTTARRRGSATPNC